MAVSIFGCISSVVLLLFYRKRKNTAAKMVKIFFLFCILGLFTAINEKSAAVLKEGNILMRNGAGEGDYDAELVWSIPGALEKEKTTLHVKEQALSEGESLKMLEKAKKEIEETFPGENDAVDAIRENVCIQSHYQNGLVLAEWSFDSYEWIDLEGNVYNEEISEKGEMVKASVELQCGDKVQMYEFYFQIFPKCYTAEERMRNDIKRCLETAESDRSGQKIVLPETMAGKQVIWETAKSRTPETSVALGAVAAACIPLAEKARLREKAKKREQMLQMEYPTLVSKISILLGAGMTLYAAWCKIVQNYQQKREKHLIEENPVYEEMLVTCHEIESGVGEIKAFERFGARCGLHRYRKFSSLLTQNLRKGTHGLTLLLEQEVSDAFEERKNLAKKYGEEAGTKMLFPMMIMFGIVIVIIMVPAMLSLK